jgi:predicted nucleic acid-binding protein
MSGPRYLLDTNVIIGFLGGASWASSFFERVASMDAELLVSTITRMELLSFPDITDEEKQRVSEILAQLNKVGIDDQIEDTAISIRSAARLKLPDAVIAATASIQGAILVTADDDFDRVSHLEVLHPNRP